MSPRNPLPVLIMISAALASVGAGVPQDQTEPLTKRANAAIAKFMGSDSPEAVGALIAIGDQTLFQGGAGPSKPGSRRTADADSSFNGEGLAHTFLVTAALQLAQSKKLNAQDLVVTHLPELLPEGCGVRVEELMSQTSGLADYVDFASAELLSNGSASYVALAGLVRDVAPVTAPGECVAVTGTNTLLLAALLEKLTDQPAENLLQELIFDKLGMSTTDYERSGLLLEASASEVPSATPAFHPRGLKSTAKDLAKFQRALIERRVLDPQTLERMETAVRLADGSSSNYRLGLRRAELHDTAGWVLGEAVGTQLGAAQVTYYPEYDLSVVVLARGKELSVEALSRDLARLVIEKPEVRTLDLPLGPTELGPFLGNFQIGCTTVVVRSEGGRVLLDELDRDPIVFLYQGENRFIARDDSDVTVTFELHDEVAVAFQLERHGLLTRAVRL